MALAQTSQNDYSTVGKSSRSQRITVKTFSGGLNNASDITTINDEELHVLENFELDANGSLVSRPPIVKISESPIAEETIDIVGYYITEDETIYAVVASVSGTYLFETVTEVYTQITTIVASGSAQYRDKLYICSVTEAGGYWDGTTFTQLNVGVKPMPVGEQLILHKSRFFLISRATLYNRGRIYFSEITTVATSINDWDTDDYFDVSRGDGQLITAIISAPNEVFIFRTKSTYYFRYETAPIDGSLEVLDATVGADNAQCIAEYEFSYLVLNNGRLYRFVSYQFYPLNDIKRVQFRQTETTASLDVFSALTVFGRRAIVWFGGGTYVLDLESGAWSMWDSPTTSFAWGTLLPRSQNDLTSDTILGITGTATPSFKGVYKAVDEYLVTNVEEMTCVAETKAFDFEIPDQWKRLFYWSADVYTARDIEGTATPIQFSAIIISWDDLATKTWDELEDGTWDNPVTKNPAVVTQIVYPALTPYRVNATFQKDMRFRRCSFRVELSTDGTSATGPVRVIAMAIHAVTKKGISDILQ